MNQITDTATIRVKIDGKDVQVSMKEFGRVISTTMKRAQTEAKKTQSAFNKIGSLSEKFFFIASSFRMVTNQMRQLTDASNKQEQATAGLAQAMKSMGRYTDETFEATKKLASQIQSEGVIGDEEILRGTKFLMTYKGISEDVMPQAMRVMADFAALTGGDVASAANILGKASMGMTGEMARYGITLSDTAKESKDFGLILKEIEEQVGGQNKALAATNAGALKQFANLWGDLKEIGGNILKTFMVPLVGVLKPLIQYLTSLSSQTQNFIGILGVAAITLGVLAKALRGVGVSARFAMGPVGWIIAAIEIISMALVTNIYGIRDRLIAFGSFLKNSWTGIIKWFKGERGGMSLGDVISKTWNDAFANIKNITKQKLPEIKYAGVAVGQAFNEGVQSGRKASLGVTGGNRNSEGLIDAFFENNANLNPATAGTGPGENGAFAQIKNSFTEIGLTADNVVGNIISSFDRLSNTIVAKMFGARVKMKDIWKAIAMDFSKLFIDEILKKVASVLITKLLTLLALFDKPANDRMAIRIGQDYAKYFTQGVMSVMGNNNLAGAMAGGFGQMNSHLSSINSNLSRDANVNVNVSSKFIYNAARFERQKEKIRMGTDLNQPFFR